MFLSSKGTCPLHRGWDTYLFAICEKEHVPGESPEAHARPGFFLVKAPLATA